MSIFKAYYYILFCQEKQTSIKKSLQAASPHGIMKLMKLFKPKHQTMNSTVARIIYAEKMLKNAELALREAHQDILSAPIEGPDLSGIIAELQTTQEYIQAARKEVENL